MKNTLLLIAIIALSVVSFNHFSMKPNEFKISGNGVINWQQLVTPGKLNKAHAFLDNDCMSCHNPIKGVQRENCVVCHANVNEILERQPTSFHADIGTCMGCHNEHLGRSSSITKMDHSLLADIGMTMLSKSTSVDDEKTIAHSYLQDFIGRKKAKGALFVHSKVSNKEALLNCASCHTNDDKHFQLFGNDCVQCHRTDMWNISEFRHPKENSRDCIQCHQAPPSHYVKHFEMMSAKIAKQPKAKVGECFKCHQSTHWTDIKKVGKFKHH
jgi:hypothetical protein